MGPSEPRWPVGRKNGPRVDSRIQLGRLKAEPDYPVELHQEADMQADIDMLQRFMTGKRVQLLDRPDSVQGE